MKKVIQEMDSKSMDIVAENIGKLKELFPDAIVEGKVDFEALKGLLGNSVESREERYSFTWNGKSKARMLAQSSSTATLRPCKEESVDWDTTKNLLIEGDNLEVLKLLQKSYHKKVKMIYIDPPYNTGKDFVYKDNFKDNIANYKEITGQVDGEGRNLSSNPETNGRFHTDWLNMMYPRLKLARNLLQDDGVVMVSIDDAEFANLKELCCEIFGEENFVATLIWEKGRKNDAKLISVGHEYILVFAKKKSFLQQRNVRWRETKPGAKEILDEYLRLRKLFKDDNLAVEKGIREFYASLPAKHPSKKHVRYNKVDDNGVWRDDNMSWPGGGGPTYDVIHPDTGIACAVPEGGWRYGTIEKMEEMIRIGKVVFRDDHTEPPIRKTYLVEVDNVDTQDDEDAVDDDNEDLPIQVAGSYFYRSALQASNELVQLFGKKVFNNPKDREVLARWIGYVGTKDDDIVIDFFAGSGTTGHAVLDLNLSNDSSIRYILVQLPETILPKSKGAKPAISFLKDLGRPCVVSELTKERLRRVANNIREQNPSYRGDLGFKVFKLDSTNIKPWELDFDFTERDLEDQISNIKNGREEVDVLYEILLKYGLDLTLPVTEHLIEGKRVFNIGKGELIVCLSDDITLDAVIGIANLKDELNPKVMRVVFKDAGFEDDVVKTNALQILKQAGIKEVRSL